MTRLARLAGGGVLLAVAAPALAEHAFLSRRQLDDTGLPAKERAAKPPARLQEAREAPSRAPAKRRPSAPGTHDAVVALAGARGVACSGVLVHPRAVLTARHCIGARRALFGATAAELRAQRSVIKVELLPNSAIDLALLVLDRDAPVAPYQLGRDTLPPARARVVGFGCTNAECRGGSGRRSFFEASLRAGDWGCRIDLAAKTGCMPEYEMLLPRGQQADTCTGDSGGAVLARDGDTWVVVAITSRSTSEAVLACGDGGIYVRVAPHLAWLQQKLRKL